MMNKIKKRRCWVCNSWFEYNTNPIHKKKGLKNYRGVNSYTCSKKCSVYYARVYNQLFNAGRIKTLKNG